MQNDRDILVFSGFVVIECIRLHKPVLDVIYGLVACYADQDVSLQQVNLEFVVLVDYQTVTVVTF